MKVRAGLQALAMAWGAPTDDLEKGYHETMTQGWVRLVEVKLRGGGAAENADAFCERETRLMQKNWLEAFYSRERLFTWAVKLEYVDPDVARFEASGLAENAGVNPLASGADNVITNV